MTDHKNISSHFPMKGILFILLLSSNLCTASYDFHSKLDTLPKVFMIGENEMNYEEVVSECGNLLLTVCQDSMSIAYKKWMGMLSDLEVFAEDNEFDIRGIKIWLNVFWNADGTIKHLVYYPKPNSRNMDFDQLTIFLGLFADSYQFEIDHKTCYSHYGSASFPTFAKMLLTREK